MGAHLRYATYVVRHKTFVFVECCRLGIPLLGIIHDLSKFLPWEWAPYVEYFYGASVPLRERIHKAVKNNWALHIRTRDADKVTQVERDFDLAWLAHIHWNKHHPQWWVLREDSGKRKALPMPDRYRREMLADWRGAGKAQRNPDSTAVWFTKNRDKMLLHPETERWIEQMLGITQETVT